MKSPTPTPRWTAIAIWLLAHGAFAEPVVVEGIAAVVGDEVILLSEVEAAVLPLIERGRRAGRPIPADALTQARREAVQALIDDKLVSEVGRRMNLETSPEEIDLAIEQIASQEGMSVEIVYASVEKQGLSREAYRRQLSQEIVKMRVVASAVRSRVNVSDEELRVAFETRYGNKQGLYVRLRHILLPWTAGPGDPKVIEIAVELRERALAGSDFGDLARQFSAAPSAPQGGLSEFHEGEMQAELARYALLLPLGEISPPIETSHGVNLLQVLERYDPSEVSFEDARDALYGDLVDRQTGPEFQRWLKELRKTKYVAVIDPSLK